MNEPMPRALRDLILAAEITGMLHDFGKVWPDFAAEGMKGGTNRSDDVKKLGFNAAHGAILEDPGRAYPPPGEESWLQEIKNHPGWAQVLRLPESAVKSGTLQALGLGDPLRQHHANNSFPEDQLTLLGDLYTFGADIRDSALDKGSGGTASGKQRLGHGFIADSFGNEQQPYGLEVLAELWPEVRRIIREILLADGAWDNVPRARARFLTEIEPVFRKALGETRRPTNDVTLWHHVRSAASLLKVAVAEGLLRDSFSHLQDDKGLLELTRIGRIRFRLLGIRWDWAGLTRGVLQPVALTALADMRTQAVARLRQRLEQDYPIGNMIYEDDDGIILTVPGFYQGANESGQTADALFRQHVLDPLLHGLLQDLAPLGAGSAVRIAWTRPALYLTDYPEVMAASLQEGSGDRQLLLQVGEEELRALWAKQVGDGQVQICPQCGLRPGRAQELELNESTLRTEDERVPQSYCDYCRRLVDNSVREKRRRQAEAWFGVKPRSFNLQEIRAERSPNNARLALLSVRVDAGRIASGEMLLTQLARPLEDLKTEFGSPDEAGAFLQASILAELDRSGEDIGQRISEKSAKKARMLVGDDYWLDFHGKNKDGRFEGKPATKSRCLVDEFFLREALPDPATGLYRHDGDKLALFGMRKHASPARLARIWDDLRRLWRQILWDVAGDTEGWLLPLSMDARGFRVIVAAPDARAVLYRIRRRIGETLGKVRAGLDSHISVLVFREKFPFYIALDALHRMERRVGQMPAQEWTLKSSLPMDNGRRLHMVWETEQGEVSWDVNLETSDPEQSDIWYPHAICTTRPAGAGRVTRLDRLKTGETIRLRPSTFDFAVLEGTTRRYSLRYDAEGRRPHFIMGEPGRRPYFLEHLGLILELARGTGWNPSQTKAIFGQVVECYEKWVRDVPDSLREQGRQAWHAHTAAILRRYLPDNHEIQQRILAMLDDGAFFDAFEWAGFIEKSDTTLVE